MTDNEHEVKLDYFICLSTTVHHCAIDTFMNNYFNRVQCVFSALFEARYVRFTRLFESFELRVSAPRCYDMIIKLLDTTLKMDSFFPMMTK